MSGEQLASLSVKQLSTLSLQQVVDISRDALSHLSSEQLIAITKGQASGIDSAAMSIASLKSKLAKQAEERLQLLLEAGGVKYYVRKVLSPGKGFSPGYICVSFWSMLLPPALFTFDLLLCLNDFTDISRQEMSQVLKFLKIFGLLKWRQ